MYTIQSEIQCTLRKIFELFYQQQMDLGKKKKIDTFRYLIYAEIRYHKAKSYEFRWMRKKNYTNQYEFN